MSKPLSPEELAVITEHLEQDEYVNTRPLYKDASVSKTVYYALDADGLLVASSPYESQIAWIIDCSIAVPRLLVTVDALNEQLAKARQVGAIRCDAEGGLALQVEHLQQQLAAKDAEIVRLRMVLKEIFASIQEFSDDGYIIGFKGWLKQAKELLGND